MRVALYARFSSERQDADLSIGSQIKALREYATKNDLELRALFLTIVLNSRG